MNLKHAYAIAQHMPPTYDRDVLLMRLFNILDDLDDDSGDFLRLAEAFPWEYHDYVLQKDGS